MLGWLYQFYISEKKDQVMARKAAVPTEDIPAVTQLFTPHWIVRYLVENSLGRLWLLNRPESLLEARCSITSIPLSRRRIFSASSAAGYPDLRSGGGQRTHADLCVRSSVCDLRRGGLCAVRDSCADPAAQPDGD